MFRKVLRLVLIILLACGVLQAQHEPTTMDRHKKTDFAGGTVIVPAGTCVGTNAPQVVVEYSRSPG